MKIVIQRVKEAYVMVESNCVGKIDHGLMLLVGIEQSDTEKDIMKAAKKVSEIRLFDDEEGVMNLSVQDVGGSILSISQFTLAADTRKGNRPSYINAMRPTEANQLYETFNAVLKEQGIRVETGQFQQDMKVSLINDGPVTIILEIKDGKVC